MKALINPRAICFLAFIAISFLFPERSKAQVYSPISVQTFYDELSPYGRWIHSPEYGYVWLPDVEPDFQPYASRGYWVMTEYGNTWVSDYVWGWAPFHYGRWYYDNYFGWAWVPGTEWGPAWVNWRTSNGYYGWAPLTPGFHVHMSVNLPINYWVFVPYRYITSPRIYNYYVPRRRVVHVYHQSVVINNVYTNNNYMYVSGPSRNDIERTTRRQVQVRNVNNTSRPDRTLVNRNSVQIYRPTVAESTRTSRPSRVAESNQAPSRRESKQRSTSENNRESNQINKPYTRRSNATGNSSPSERRTFEENQDNNEQRSSLVQERSRSSNNNESSRQSSAPARSSENNVPSQRRVAPSQPAQRTQENAGRSTERRIENGNIQQPNQRSQEGSNGSEMRRSSVQPSTEHRQEAQPQQHVERRTESRTPSSSGRQETRTSAPQQRREVSRPSETRTSSGSQQQAPARQSQDSPKRSSGRGRTN